MEYIISTFTSSIFFSNSKKYIIKRRKKLFIFNKSVLIKLKTFSHPNIIKIYEIYSDLEYNYIKMEYFDGIILENCNLKKYNTNKIIKQLIDVVTFFNKNNIISLDINPKKILVNKNNEIKVIDFTRSFLNPKKYNLDEIYFGFNVRNIPKKTLDTGIIDLNINIYSLGICIYYLVYKWYPMIDDMYFKKDCQYKDLIQNLILSNQDS